MDFRKELRQEELLVLEGCGRRVGCRSGETVSFNPYQDVLFLLNGALQAKGFDASGKTLVRTYTTGEVINELSVLTAQVSRLRVTALIQSISLLVSQARIDSLVTENPKVAAKLFRHFAKLIIYRTVPLHASSASSHPLLHATDSLSEAC